MNASDLDRRYAAAQATWPGIAITRDEFAHWIAERAAVGVDELNSDELYLTCACARNAPGAISTLQAHYFNAVVAAVARFGPASFAEDVKQELLQRLFVASDGSAARIASYSGRGGLSSWLRAVAVRIALNLTRSKKHQRHDTLEDNDFIGLADPALAHIKRTYRAEFKQAFAQAVAALEAELQTILRLYYLDGLDLAEIGTIYAVSAPTISRRLARARTQLLDGTRARLQDRLQVDGAELDSIMDLIQSRLSFEGFAGDEPEA